MVAATRAKRAPKEPKTAIKIPRRLLEYPVKRLASRLAALANRVSTLGVLRRWADNPSLAGLSFLPTGLAFARVPGFWGLGGRTGRVGFPGFANFGGFGGLTAFVGLGFEALETSGALGKPVAAGELARAFP